MAPAFPATGRTTVGGVQLVDGEPVHRTRFARDPVSPVLESDLVRLLGARHVAAGASPAAALAAGGLVVCDAETEEDLEALVRAVPDPAVGAVGRLGRAGRRARRGPSRRRARTSADEDEDAGGPVLVVVGSANATAREQIARLVEAGVPAAPLRLERLGAGEAAAAAPRAPRRRSRRPASASCIPSGRGTAPICPARIAAALADAAAAAAERAAVGGLVLTGGDTAVHVARRLGATGLLVEDELEPGVVVGRLLGPRRYRIVTKAGGFGSPDALRTASAALAARGRSPGMSAERVIAITMGDPTGVGPEIVAKVFAEGATLARPRRRRRGDDAAGGRRWSARRSRSTRSTSPPTPRSSRA